MVSTVLSLTGGSDLPAEEVESLERESILMQDVTVVLKLTTIAILDASLADPALNAALSKRGATARHLVKRLTDAAHPPAGSSELQRKYIQLTVEVCSDSGTHVVKIGLMQDQADALKAGRHSLETQLSEVRESRDQYKIELDRTRKALDRQRMEHDKAELEWRQNSSREQGTPGPKPNGLGHATPNGKIEEVCLGFSYQEVEFLLTSAGREAICRHRRTPSRRLDSRQLRCRGPRGVPTARA